MSREPPTETMSFNFSSVKPAATEPSPTLREGAVVEEITLPFVWLTSHDEPVADVAFKSDYFPLEQIGFSPADADQLFG